MKAQPLQVSKWLNAPQGFELDLKAPSLKVIFVFQMLCPACVYRSVPQAMELHALLKGQNIQVVGLHSVFEHHDVMSEEALKVFIHEWRLQFPVGIDFRKDGQWMPETMKAYNMQGTPTLIVIDETGELRLQHFGHLETSQLLNLLQNEQNKSTPTAK